jgi:hypothetical protein
MNYPSFTIGLLLKAIAAGIGEPSPIENTGNHWAKLLAVGPQLLISVVEEENRAISSTSSPRTARSLRRIRYGLARCDGFTLFLTMGGSRSIPTLSNARCGPSR